MQRSRSHWHLIQSFTFPRLQTLSLGLMESAITPTKQHLSSSLSFSGVFFPFGTVQRQFFCQGKTSMGLSPSVSASFCLLPSRRAGVQMAGEHCIPPTGEDSILKPAKISPAGNRIKQNPKYPVARKEEVETWDKFQKTVSALPYLRAALEGLMCKRVLLGK